jgi:hypothetical protein
MLGDNTPRYLGAGQPAIQGSTILDDGTPAYLVASTTGAEPTASAMSTEPAAAQPGQVAIVVPRP